MGNVDQRCASEFRAGSREAEVEADRTPIGERLTDDERAELARLRDEVRQLRAEREIRRILATCVADARARRAG